TWVSRTGRPEGGWQQFFRHPGNGTTIGNRAGLRPGLDVRGDGGYVILPPSLHASGRHYEWLTAPEDTELAPLSESLRQIMVSPAPATDAPSGDDVIPEGHRNEALYRIARGLLHRLSREAALVAPLEENRRRCRPPLSNREISAIVDHAATQPHRPEFMT